MAKASFIQKGGTIDYTNGSGVAIAYRDVIPATTRIIIAGDNIGVGAVGSAHVEGIFSFPAINTAAFAVADKVYWDNTAGKITNVAAGNTPAGWVAETKAEAGTTAVVCLDGADAPSSFKKGERFFVNFPDIAAADVAKIFFIAPEACKFIEATERHVTVAGQAGTMQIEKLNTGEAPGAGDVLLAAAFDLASTANTPVVKAGVTTAAASLVKGDALCLKLASGAATSYALGTITVTMEWM